MSPARAALYRTLSFHEAWQYAPTRAELLFTLDAAHAPVQRREAFDELHHLLQEKVLDEVQGRIGFSETLPSLTTRIQERDMLQPRKRRRAVAVTKWLSYLPGVRFVALANTTALGSARDYGDLDFFVVCKAGSLWSTRLYSVSPLKALRLLPRSEETRDAVCLSYFVSDDALDLKSHLLAGDDPYFRYWFLSLMPLYDDGVGEQLWNANASILARHPFRRAWMAPPDIRVRHPLIKFPLFSIETVARTFQRAWFPKQIRDLLNQDSRVIVSDQALKFHVEDGRAAYRQTYERLCSERSVSP
jgi:hypothetical protein